jgi:hypothetical protein
MKATIMKTSKTFIKSTQAVLIILFMILLKNAAAIDSLYYRAEFEPAALFSSEDEAPELMTRSQVLNQDTNFSYEGQVGPDFGRLFSVAFHPIHKDVIYASNFFNRQLFRSMDGGVSWEYIYSAPNDAVYPYTDTRMGGLKFANPQEPTHLYFYLDNSTWLNVSNRGLYIMDVITHEIINIIQIPYEDRYLDIRDYDVCQSNPDNIVFMATIPHSELGRMIWVTNNNGEDFRQISSSSINGRIFPSIVRFNPVNPEHIIIGLNLNNNTIYDGGFLITENGGESFSYKNSGIPIGDIAFDPINPNNAYAVSGWSGIPQKFLSSKDGGISWQAKTPDIDISSGGLSFFNSLAINPDNPDNIIVTHNYDILTTNDAGETWTSVQYEYDDAEYFAGFEINFDPHNTDKIFICSDMRPMQSFDRGISWEPLKNKNIFIFNMHAVKFPNGEKYLYYDAPASYFAYNLETEKTYGNIRIGYIEDFIIHPDKYTQNRAFVAKSHHGGRGITIYKNDDNFETTPVVIYHEEIVNLMHHVVRCPENPDTYLMVLPYNQYFGNAKLMRTLNGFQTIQQITITGMIELISTLTSVDGQPGVFWAFAANAYESGAYKSTNYGNSWTKLSNGLPVDIGIWNIAVNPNNPDNLVASVSMGKGLYVTMNGGESWSPAFTDFECTQISFSKEHENIVFAHRRSIPGIVYSLDGGLNWYEVPENVIIDANNLSFQTLDYDETIDIFIAAEEMGVLKYTFTVPYYFANFNIVNQSGNPVSGATITVNGHEYEQGKYMINKLRSGTYNFKIVGSGYDDYDGSFTVINEDISIYVMLTGDGPVNIPENNLSGFEIFPNPAINVIFIQAPEEISKLEFINIKGQVVLQSSPNNTQVTLNVSEVKNGIYFLKLHTSNGFEIRKVQISK